MDRDDLPREWAFIEMVSVCVCACKRCIIIIMPHSRGGILTELIREQAHREIAFCRLIIIQSFHHGLNRLMGRGTPTSRPENLWTAVTLCKEAAQWRNVRRNAELRGAPLLN